MKTGQTLLRSLSARLNLVRPIYAHYGVTHRCNMQCRMCVVWKSGCKETELTIPQVTELAGALYDAGVRMITLGGGEPFMRKDISELVNMFARKRMEIRLLTNGIGLSDDAITSVVRSGIKHVSVSLDTLDPALEKEIYNGKDVWDEIVFTMKRFRELLNDPASTPIMNVCVCRSNLAELPELVQFAAQKGFYCSFVPISLSASEDTSDGFAAVAPELAIPESEFPLVEKIYAQLLEMKKHGAPIANSSRFLRDSATYIKTGVTGWKCDAGRLYLSVSPEGNISICHQFPSFSRADKLVETINSPYGKEKMTNERDSCDGCMRPCWAEVTHAMRHLPSSYEAFMMTRKRQNNLNSTL